LDQLDPTTPASAPASDVSEAGGGRRCECGFDRHHPMVSPERFYTKFGSFWVFFFGVSYTPIRVAYRCRVCDQSFDETTDPELLHRYI